MNILRVANPLIYNALLEGVNDRMLNRGESESNFGFPRANVIDQNDDSVIELAVPGYSKEQLEIRFHDHILEISAKVDSEEAGKGKLNYLSREFRSKSFIRRFSVPQTMDVDQINARYSDGILRVTIPKREEAKDKGPKNILIS